MPCRSVYCKRRAPKRTLLKMARHLCVQIKATALAEKTHPPGKGTAGIKAGPHQYGCPIMIISYLSIFSIYAADPRPMPPSAASHPPGRFDKKQPCPFPSAFSWQCLGFSCHPRRDVSEGYARCNPCYFLAFRRRQAHAHHKKFIVCFHCVSPQN